MAVEKSLPDDIRPTFELLEKLNDAVIDSDSGMYFIEQDELGDLISKEELDMLTDFVDEHIGFEGTIETGMIGDGEPLLTVYPDFVDSFNSFMGMSRPPVMGAVPDLRLLHCERVLNCGENGIDAAIHAVEVEAVEAALSEDMRNRSYVASVLRSPSDTPMEFVVVKEGELDQFFDCYTDFKSGVDWFVDQRGGIDSGFRALCFGALTSDGHQITTDVDFRRLSFGADWIVDNEPEQFEAESFDDEKEVTERIAGFFYTPSSLEPIDDAVELAQREAAHGRVELAKSLWAELGDVCIDENERIDTEWRGYPAGTHREDIWHNLEEKFEKDGVTVAKLMGIEPWEKAADEHGHMPDTPAHEGHDTEQHDVDTGER